MSDRSGYQPKNPKEVLKEFYYAFQGRRKSYDEYMKPVTKKKKKK